MKFNDCQEKINQIKLLARFANTGTPKELAKILNLNERTLYRLIKTINQNKIELQFCRKAKSYILKN